MNYERIGGLVPEKIREWTANQLEYSGINVSAERFLGYSLLMSIAAALILSGIGLVLFKFNPVLGFFIVFFLLIGTILFLVTNAADKEGNNVEKILPDALQLIASNIKSGLTTEKSLLASARPEFGALSSQLKYASKRILSGEPIDSALLLISKKIKSRVLDRTMWLISEGIRNGGQIASLLLQLSNDLREENALKAETNANISMYVMLIFFSAAFGAPLLFGISSFIVGVLSEQASHANIPIDIVQEYGAKSPALGLIAGNKTGITEEFIVFYIQVALFLTCIFASLILGIITTGNEKGGIRFIPIILIISFVLFYLTRIIVASMFGGMIR